MNPAHFHRPDLETLNTLAHEMAHLWQHHFGKPSRNGYHNQEWARKMIAIGLTPTHTGTPGGKMTDQRVTHLITLGGAFERAARGLIDTDLTLKWRSREHAKAGKPSKNKTKYTCLECGQSAWAKPGARLICGDCKEPMGEQ